MKKKTIIHFQGLDKETKNELLKIDKKAKFSKPPKPKKNVGYCYIPSIELLANLGQIILFVLSMYDRWQGNNFPFNYFRIVIQRGKKRIEFNCMEKPSRQKIKKLVDLYI